MGSAVSGRKELLSVCLSLFTYTGYGIDRQQPVGFGLRLTDNNLWVSA
jgi:hypothetical protein